MLRSPDARSPNHGTAVLAGCRKGRFSDAWRGRPRQLAVADAPAEIEYAIVCRYPPRQNLLIPVTWGFVSWGECDLLKVEKSGYLTEFEIKTSVADLQREWKKKRWTNSVRPSVATLSCCRRLSRKKRRPTSRRRLGCRRHDGSRTAK